MQARQRGMFNQRIDVYMSLLFSVIFLSFLHLID